MSDLWHYLTGVRAEPHQPPAHVEEPLPLEGLPELEPAGVEAGVGRRRGTTLGERAGQGGARRPGPGPAGRRRRRADPGRPSCRGRPAHPVPPPVKEPARQPRRTPSKVLDLVGVGLGAANLSLAALSDGLSGLSYHFFDEQPRFGTRSSHPDPLPENFLGDLVTLVEPTSPWSFLSYLHAHCRMYPFFVAGHPHPTRAEYDEYLRWVASALPNCQYGARVDTVGWDGEAFVIRIARTADAVRDELALFSSDGVRATVRARNVVLGVGTGASSPRRPDCLRLLSGLVEWGDHGGPVADSVHRVNTAPTLTGGLYVQYPSPEDAPPDQRIPSYRNAAILNQIAGRELYSPAAHAVLRTTS